MLHCSRKQLRGSRSLLKAVGVFKWEQSLQRTKRSPGCVVFSGERLLARTSTCASTYWVSWEFGLKSISLCVDDMPIKNNRVDDHIEGLVDRVFGSDFGESDDDQAQAPPRRLSRVRKDLSDSDNEGDRVQPVRKVKAKESRRSYSSDNDNSSRDERDGSPTRSSSSSAEDEEDEEDDIVRPSKLSRDSSSGRSRKHGSKERRREREQEREIGRRRRLSKRRGSPEVPVRRRSAVDDIEDDDFIDDSGAPQEEADDDDVIHTEGGWTKDNDIEDDAHDEEDDRRKLKKPKSAFDRVLDEQKAARRPRKKEMDPHEIDAQVVDFLQQMMKARDDDVASYNSGKPALCKLRMLPKVRSMFVRHEFRESFLDHMMLAVVKVWLEPMYDGALPNVEIRSTLLEILSTFKVDSSWVDRLENSQGLGKIINYLSRKDDDVNNRRMAKKLMMSWSRPFYNSNADFHDLRDDYDNDSEITRIRREAQVELEKLTATNQKKIDLLKSSIGREDGEEKVRVMAELPQKTSFLFTKMAESEVEGRVTRNRRAPKQKFTNRKNLNRRLNVMKAVTKFNNSRGFENPSINGRR